MLDKLFSNGVRGKSRGSSLDDRVSHKKTHLRLGFFYLRSKKEISPLFYFILFHFLLLLNYKYTMNERVENLFLSHHLRHSYGH